MAMVRLTNLFFLTCQCCLFIGLILPTYLLDRHRVFDHAVFVHSEDPLMMTFHTDFHTQRSSDDDLHRDLGFTDESMPLLKDWNNLDMQLYALGGVFLRQVQDHTAMPAGKWMIASFP